MSSLNTTKYLEAINRTSVWEHGHVILNSGRHSYDKAYMERLAGYADEFGLVMSGVKSVLRDLELSTVVGVANGARDLLHPMVYRPEFLTVETNKQAPREFEVVWTDRSVIKSAKRAAIFEDVTTTGGTPAAMANTLHAINPELELHLVTILQRGDLKPEHAAQFASVTVLAVDLRPSWEAKDCLNEACRLVA